MRRIVGAAFLSLDGVMQAPGGPSEDTSGGFSEGGWQFKFPDATGGEAVGDMLAGDYDLLLGRRTYDIFAAYWPYVQGEEAELGKAFTQARKYVLTRGTQELPWENSHRLGSIADVAALKQGDGPELRIWGSGTIYPGLLSQGLIDRLRLLIYPLTLGKGKRLFGEGTPAQAMKMVHRQITDQGTIIADYEPTGTMPKGAFQGPEPATSERERERQRRMAEGTW
ncbi:MAG: dihydrofolate reductase family protein [Novosphingobium sp.]